MLWYSFDESYINNFKTNVNAVIVAKANELSAKFFRPLLVILQSQSIPITRYTLNQKSAYQAVSFLIFL